MSACQVIEGVSLRIQHRWRAGLRALRRDVIALSLAIRDPRVPWHAKAAIFLVLAYALSPLDLVPDFIPVLGYVDDVIIVPVGVLLVRQLIPDELLAEHRRSADERVAATSIIAKVGIGLVLATWAALLTVVLWVVL